MNQQAYKKSFVIGAVAIGMITGITIGFFIAHGMMGSMIGMTMGTGDVSASPGRAGELGEAGVSAPAGRAGELGDMKQMDMKDEAMQGMPGMAGTPSGAVVVPAVTRQLIGVRSAPAAYAILAQEIRAVGTVGYDERGLTQVTVKTSGWVREVFVDSIGRPVRKGDPLFTLYSPDLLATQDEYLLAVKTQAQLAVSPLGEVKANAASLVASTRERLRLWDVTDAQMAALERRGKAEPVLTVYAPSSGIVMKREALPGKYVEPGTTLYEVADLSTVWISADIYESEVAAVTLNQPASVTFAAYPGETFRGHGLVHLLHAEYRGPHGTRAGGNAESWTQAEARHVRNRHLGDRCGEDVGCSQGSRTGHRTSATRVHGSWRRSLCAVSGQAWP